MKRSGIINSLLAVLIVAAVSFGFTSKPEVAAGTPKIGDKAPDIEEVGPNGTTYKLSDLEGHLVLLDFWASWCGPCRRANPEIVAVYEKFKDEKFDKGIEGFTVFSVSLDKSKPRWESAIEKDNLSWEYHVSDLRGWSSAPAALYGVRSIPSTFLLDQDGYVIGRNLSAEALEYELERRLKKKKK